MGLGWTSGGSVSQAAGIEDLSAVTRRAIHLERTWSKRTASMWLFHLLRISDASPCFRTQALDSSSDPSACVTLQSALPKVARLLRATVLTKAHRFQTPGGSKATRGKFHFPFSRHALSPNGIHPVVSTSQRSVRVVIGYSTSGCGFPHHAPVPSITVDKDVCRHLMEER